MTASMRFPWRPAGCLGAVVLAVAAAGAARAETLAGPALVKALQGGGYVLVMRHAASPQNPPTAVDADPQNTAHERQLDETGRQSAVAMGAAFKALHIRVGQVWSSPTYRARETARLAGLPMPTAAPELGDRGQNMQAAAADQSAWLKAKAAERPAAGTDTVIITHFPNISAAFGTAAAGIADGEVLVFHPTGAGAADLVGRVKIEDWPKLGS